MSCSFSALSLTLGLAACAWQAAGPPTRLNLTVTPLTLPVPAGEGFKLIYSFPGGAGGSNPGGGLTFVNGIRFGTTPSGGDVSGCNCGTVFAGTKVIYDFKGVANADGGGPQGYLLLVGSKLYGTTGYGGRNKGACAKTTHPGCGTVYEIDTAGNERVIYQFKGGTDGGTPVGGLLYRKGVFYGVTVFGGTSGACYPSSPQPGCGVVFRIDSSGHEAVIYRFKGGSDGEFPITHLLSMNGKMYGTTVNGGGATLCPAGCGTIFSITPAGKESVVYVFKGGKDGLAPLSPLVTVNGFLYGTTAAGGCVRACGPYKGGGTLFKMSPSGSETVLHRFINTGINGTGPSGALAVLNGRFFGTTATARYPYGGTIYDATSTQFKYLYYFPNAPGNAQHPNGLSLKPSTGDLYGTATVGGANGYGAIFRYSP